MYKIAKHTFNYASSYKNLDYTYQYSAERIKEDFIKLCREICSTRYSNYNKASLHSGSSASPLQKRARHRKPVCFLQQGNF